LNLIDSGKWRKAKTRNLATVKKLRTKEIPVGFCYEFENGTLINAGDFEGDCKN
jgi:hypothetical protein